MKYCAQAWKTQKYVVFSKCLLRHDVLRVYESYCVLVFERAICHGALNTYIVYNILYLNISSIYINQYFL